MHAPVRQLWSVSAKGAACLARSGFLNVVVDDDHIFSICTFHFFSITTFVNPRGGTALARRCRISPNVFFCKRVRIGKCYFSPSLLPVMGW